MTGLCFVSAFYNEQPNLPVLLRELDQVAGKIEAGRGITCSAVLVDDGSTDDFRQALAGVRLASIRVDVISLSRNFGKEVALSAGLQHASGEAVVVIDADLQHPPELIPEFVRLWQDEGKDVVYAYKSDRRGEGWLRVGLGRVHHALLNGGTRAPIPKDAGDYRLMTRRVVDALNALPERERYMKGLFAWVGFEQHGIPFAPRQRGGGRTKWRFGHLLDLSINGIVSFSTAPIRIISITGAVIALASLIYGIWIVLEKLILGNDVPGFPALAAMIAFIGAAQLISIGIIGEYVARLVSETKGRPLFIVKDRWRLESGPVAADDILAPDR